MEQPERLVEHRHERRPSSLTRRVVGVGGESRLYQLEIPIADLAPKEVIEPLRDLVQAEAFEAPRRIRGGGLQARQDPAVLEREVVGHGAERLHRGVAETHECEATRVPDLVGEVAPVGKRTLDVLVVEADVGTHRTLAHDRVAHGVGAKLLHHPERVDPVAE